MFFAPKGVRGGWLEDEYSKVKWSDNRYLQALEASEHCVRKIQFPDMLRRAAKGFRMSLKGLSEFSLCSSPPKGVRGGCGGGLKANILR